MAKINETHHTKLNLQLIYRSKKHTRGVDRQDKERTWEDKTRVPKVS